MWRCPPWRVRPGHRAVGKNSIAAELKGYVGDGQLTRCEADLAVADSRSVGGAKRKLAAALRKSEGRRVSSDWRPADAADARRGGRGIDLYP